MTNSSISNVKENVRKYRLERNLSQDKLAEMVGVTVEYISLIERGKRSPSLKRLYKIADILEVEAYELLR